MPSERITELLELLAEEPDDPLLLMTLGSAHLEAGDAAAAVAPLERAIAVDPRYSAAYRHLGSALAAVGRRAEAAATWERGMAVADETGDIQAGKEMGVLLKRLRGS